MGKRMMRDTEDAHIATPLSYHERRALAERMVRDRYLTFTSNETREEWIERFMSDGSKPSKEALCRT